MRTDCVGNITLGRHSVVDIKATDQCSSLRTGGNARRIKSGAVFAVQKADAYDCCHRFFRPGCNAVTVGKLIQNRQIHRQLYAKIVLDQAAVQHCHLLACDVFQRREAAGAHAVDNAVFIRKRNSIAEPAAFFYIGKGCDGVIGDVFFKPFREKIIADLCEHGTRKRGLRLELLRVIAVLHQACFGNPCNILIVPCLGGQIFVAPYGKIVWLTPGKAGHQHACQ